MSDFSQSQYPLGDRFEQALRFAASLHRNQYRKETKIPYVSHLLRVAGLALEFGADEEIAMAALLHDAIEDQGGLGTAAIIRDQFGNRVADIVLECSDSVRDKNTPKADWHERKSNYIERLRTGHCSGALLVSACDKLDNLTCIWRDWQKCGDDCFRIFKTGKEGQQWYYSQLLQIYEERKTPPAGEIRMLYDTVF